MPRKFNPPKYCLHKAKGLAFVKIAGRVFYLGKYGTPESHAEYNRLIGEWMTLGRPTEFRDRLRSEVEHRRTINELVLAYWTNAQTYYVKGGETTDECHCIKSALRVLRELYGDSAVDDFGPLALKTVRQAMIERDWSRKYCNKQVLRIRRMFSWGVENELVRPEIAQALKFVSGLRAGKTEAKDRPRVLPVDDETIEATLKELDPTLQAMVQVQRLTGMRPQEICLLTPGQLDRAAEVWIYLPDRHKNEHRDLKRVVAIGPKAQEILLPYLLRPSDQYCFQPTRSNRPHYEKNGYRERIWKACRRAFPAPKTMTAPERAEWDKAHRWSPNQLRHAAATEIRAKFGLEAAQVVLGHTKASTTEIYAERDLRLAVEVAKKLG